MIDVLGASLLRGLMCKDIPFHDVMNAFNIKTTIAFNMSSKIHGFVYVSKKGNYHIILNGNISYETQCHTFLHEINHILRDLPQMNYIIGLDMQHERFEMEADKLAFL
ncbi:Zn-dependent peptidase ImmA (M78 family) [Anaerosolibacter carboniphilus]|uniref:Zn-dependent peptidase ImmA (M78 family) n=1 Tax=Anaerosolibacter carboniphilus TaxID=1417629 RepID=A0A841KY03_9FIRM|nr:hypothetical protein [Anaerosolibacter carboniphilus]MBB6218223.1 Zn-dependent peptidase ImmA (M78 family) [Anaerosolibacter carboniphilus]